MVDERTVDVAPRQPDDGAQHAHVSVVVVRLCLRLSEELVGGGHEPIPLPELDPAEDQVSLDPASRRATETLRDLRGFFHQALGFLDVAP